MRAHMEQEHFDAIVIGSGFGGAMAAHVLVRAGWRVLLLERGPWVNRGPHNWSVDPRGLDPYYGRDPFVLRGDVDGSAHLFECVGGPSVFYGAASFRLRARDFQAVPEIVGDSAAAWPFDYEALEPHYGTAERLLGVAGVEGEDPTEPTRSTAFPVTPPPLSVLSGRLRDAAIRLGLHPLRVPLAVNRQERCGRPRCIACAACDGFACAIGAKNDIATAILPSLLESGMSLRPNTAVLRLEWSGDRVRAVECADTATGERHRFSADHFILSAGAVGSPRLLLASELQRANPASSWVGAGLMLHCNGVVTGLFPRSLGPGDEMLKQVAVHDFYFGHPGVRGPSGKLGSIQQMDVAVSALVRANLPSPVAAAARLLSRRLAGLLVMAEDQPRAANRILLHPTRKDAFGVPLALIHHRYSDRDRDARKALAKQAALILREAGALATCLYAFKSFTHAMGSVRMGEDPHTAPLDPFCRFRGMENLRVIDGSFMPTGGAVNPSLTIAANAIRAAEELVGAEVPPFFGSAIAAPDHAEVVYV